MTSSRPDFCPLTFRQKVRHFVQNEVIPYTQDIETRQHVDDSLLKKIAHAGFLGANISPEFGGGNLNSEELGILHEEFGKSHSSVENILTVVSMASAAIKRANSSLKSIWLPKIVKGEVLPAFAMSEPNVGSDINHIETFFESTKKGYKLKGKKKWITLGSRADIFVVFAQNQGQGAAFLVEKNTRGIDINPIKDMLGFRGNMLAEITLNDCEIPSTHLIGKIGSGINLIASLALNEGRYTTAWGAVGLAQAAYLQALKYVSTRKQPLGNLLRDLDTVKQSLAKMAISIQASRQLCRYAGLLRERGDSEAIQMILMAKYHSSKTATQVSERAVQMLGALGCHHSGGIERYFRDAKIMELIEGASEVLEVQIGHLLREDDEFL